MIDEKIKTADIAKQVKYNCDISDAKYWGYFSLCGLLLRLRDLYKSEHNISPWSNINNKDIGDWITAKEALWTEIEEQGFMDLYINGHTFNPFDASEINSYLIKDNLIYGAGLGLYKKPVFFLGDLDSYNDNADYKAYFVKREYARCLFASSGMLQGKDIFIRLDPLKSLLWEMFLDMKCRKGGFLENIFSGSGITPEDAIDSEFEMKIEKIALRYSDIILNHEIAEAFNTTDEWSNIIFQIEDRKTEYFLRGLKDMIADTSEYGPLKKIIDAKDKGGLAFYISLAEMFHKTVYPELKEVFSAFAFNEDWSKLENARIQVFSKAILLKNNILETRRMSRNEEEFIMAIKDIS